MKYFKSIFCICLFVLTYASAQTKQITLEAIWKGAFRTEGLDVLHPMVNGQYYSVFNFDWNNKTSSIDVYEYKTSNKVKTLLSSEDIPQLQYFSDYTFSKDETKVLLATEEESVYRYSILGKYFVYDVKTGATTSVSEEKIQQPTFSPDGTKVAFALNNNLFVKDLISGKTTQITFEGEKNKIINGITDWVYEEEFAFVRAFEWNANGSKIAFIRFDETDVPEFSMDIYDNNPSPYPSQYVFKYPKAGEKNALVSLHVYDLGSNQIKDVRLNKTYQDFYIPRIKWTNDSDILSAQYMNRGQNELDLWFVNTKTNNSKIVLAEKDNAYIDVTDNLTFLKDNSFIWTSEKDGYNHIYQYSKSGTLINQITKGAWEVTDFYGYDEKTQTVFYQSVEQGSINRDVYAVKLNGKNKTRLSAKTGANEASFSADYTMFINTFSSATTPPEYSLHDAVSGKQLKAIKDNKVLLENLSQYQMSKKEFSTIKINENDLNMWMLRPSNFDASKKHPLFMVQYSGPGSQEVANKWFDINDYWFQYLAQQGYIVVCVDGRGTGFKGAAFKKMTQNQLGKYEVEDQIQVAKQLGTLPYVDASRIGIWGWSYGGFMSANCLFQAPEVFKMAIAVAPVSSWRFYDTIYTERYMGLPQNNASGYDNNSPISHVNKLQGDFLLVHGSADDNVHVQNTMLLAEALIQADKDFEWSIYPDKNHGIYGGNTRLHLYKKMTNFIHQTLGDKTQ